METRPTVDHAFLETVQAELEQALRQIDALDVPADEPAAHTGEPWRDALSALSSHLVGWQGRLSELGARTDAIEAELTEQEQALRTWFTALGITSEHWLSQVGGKSPHPSAQR